MYARRLDRLLENRLNGKGSYSLCIPYTSRPLFPSHFLSTISWNKIALALLKRHLGPFFFFDGMVRLLGGGGGGGGGAAAILPHKTGACQSCHQSCQRQRSLVLRVSWLAGFEPNCALLRGQRATSSPFLTRKACHRGIIDHRTKQTTTVTLSHQRATCSAFDICLSHLPINPLLAFCCVSVSQSLRRRRAGQQPNAGGT